MWNKDRMNRIEEKYLNVGRVLTDGELREATARMNAEYMGEEYRESNAVPMTPFCTAYEKALKEIQGKYDLKDKYENRLHQRELMLKLNQWARKRYQK